MLASFDHRVLVHPIRAEPYEYESAIVSVSSIVTVAGKLLEVIVVTIVKGMEVSKAAV